MWSRPSSPTLSPPSRPTSPTPLSPPHTLFPPPPRDPPLHLPNHSHHPPPPTPIILLPRLPFPLFPPRSPFPPPPFPLFSLFPPAFPLFPPFPLFTPPCPTTRAPRPVWGAQIPVTLYRERGAPTAPYLRKAATFTLHHALPAAAAHPSHPPDAPSEPAFQARPEPLGRAQLDLAELADCDGAVERRLKVAPGPAMLADVAAADRPAGAVLVVSVECVGKKLSREAAAEEAQWGHRRNASSPLLPSTALHRAPAPSHLRASPPASGCVSPGVPSAGSAGSSLGEANFPALPALPPGAGGALTQGDAHGVPHGHGRGPWQHGQAVAEREADGGEVERDEREAAGGAAEGEGVQSGGDVSRRKQQRQTCRGGKTGASNGLRGVREPGEDVGEEDTGAYRSPEEGYRRRKDRGRGRGLEELFSGRQGDLDVDGEEEIDSANKVQELDREGETKGDDEFQEEGAGEQREMPVGVKDDDPAQAGVAAKPSAAEADGQSGRNLQRGGEEGDGGGRGSGGRSPDPRRRGDGARGGGMRSPDPRLNRDGGRSGGARSPDPRLNHNRGGAVKGSVVAACARQMHGCCGRRSVEAAIARQIRGSTETVGTGAERAHRIRRGITIGGAGGVGAHLVPINPVRRDEEAATARLSSSVIMERSMEVRRARLTGTCSTKEAGEVDSVRSNGITVGMKDAVGDLAPLADISGMMEGTPMREDETNATAEREAVG
ncbi:unnamed protein product [Closterium sp. Yama58-4]|nr:unnamed protein product [Closterium sp. Yama58-4]